jgi:hypothetical protein
MKHASEKQIQFIHGLIDERDLHASPKFFDTVNAMDAEELVRYLAGMKAKATTLNVAQASQWIERLKTLPLKSQRILSTQPTVDAGHYAVEHEGVLKFYRVTKPTEGRWAGYTFLDVYASDERHPIRNRSTKNEILGLIAADPDAGPRYGREIGSCYVCNRTLTDETSRHLGIGPVCRGDA